MQTGRTYPSLPVAKEGPGHVHAALYDPLWGPWLEQYAAYVYEFLPATRAITTLRDR